MTFQPGPTLVLVLLGLCYVHAVRALGRRGFRVSRMQQGYWWTGLAILAAAFVSPLDTWAQRALSAHMAQHVLMGDVATPLMMIGLRNPVLQNYLPRPVLVPLAHRRGLRRIFRKIRKPAYAIPIYTVALYAWHWDPAFTGALRNSFVHALQHQSFILFGALAWWPLIEPNKRRLPAALWKIPYIIAVRLPTMFLGMAFIVVQTPVYASFYGSGTRGGGLSWSTDQQIGGALMMMMDVAILMIGLCVMFWRAAREDDANTPVGEAAAQRDLAGVHEEREVQAGVQVAEVRQ